MPSPLRVGKELTVGIWNLFLQPILQTFTGGGVLAPRQGELRQGVMLTQPGAVRLCSGRGRAAWLLGGLGMNSRCRISMQKKSSAGLTLFCSASTRTPQGKPAQRQTCHSNSAGLRLSRLKPHPKSPEISEEAWK